MAGLSWNLYGAQVFLLLHPVAAGVGVASAIVCNYSLPEFALNLSQHVRSHATDVRQSAFAFIGDLAKTCMPHLRQCLPAYMPILIQNLNPQPVSVCNNASWAIGISCAFLFCFSGFKIDSQVTDHCFPDMLNIGYIPAKKEFFGASRHARMLPKSVPASWPTNRHFATIWVYTIAMLFSPGEIAVKIEGDIRPWVPEIIDRMIPIMNQVISFGCISTLWMAWPARLLVGCARC